MEFRLFPPIDGQCKGDAEGDDVKERNDEKPASAWLKWRILKRAMVMAVEIPSTGIVIPSATPNQPSLRCKPTLCVRTSVDCRIYKEHPSGKDGGMEIKDKGTGQSGADEVLV
jgi:hypothetical protein